jgi:Flp pilus assembly protein CpaB
MLLPGRRVDAGLPTRNNSKDVPETTVRTVLQDIQVRRQRRGHARFQGTGNCEQIDCRQDGLALVTLDHAKLTLASEMGKIAA